MVNKFEFMTSRQIFQMLEWEHIDIESQDKLNNKLEQLTKSKILTRYYFDCKDGKRRISYILFRKNGQIFA